MSRNARPEASGADIQARGDAGETAATSDAGREIADDVDDASARRASADERPAMALLQTCEGVGCALTRNESETSRARVGLAIRGI